MRICANPQCGIEYTPGTFNHKFCTPDCRKVVTNARLMERYYENRDRRRGKLRLCRLCDQPLSRYNETKECQACTAKKNTDARERLLELIGA